MTMTGARTLANLSRTILLVGAGKMGGALLEGWLGLGLDPKYAAILEPNPARELTALAGRGLRLNPSASAIGEASAIIIAVKPQMASEVVPGLASYVGAGTVVVSIMAGQTLDFLEQALSQRATVAVPNVRVSGRQRELVHALLSATGAVEWIEDEALMDAVTAVSGSGPAYVFLLVEALAQAGAAAGLPADLAARLARATVAGSGELLQRSPLDPASLRQNVTSPGGTTAAALEVLMGPQGLAELMARAVAAAAERSRQLAG
jgi:pyrroline-5-carboxylate reductase